MEEIYLPFINKTPRALKELWGK